MLKDSMLSSDFSVHVLKIASNWLLSSNWPKDSLATNDSRETRELQTDKPRTASENYSYRKYFEKSLFVRIFQIFKNSVSVAAIGE